jgi:hypothetical protein
MTTPSATCIAFLAVTAISARGEGLRDRTDEIFSFSGFNDQVRAHFSGTFDLEYYHFSNEATGLVFTDQQELFNPRLTLFFDAQLGSSFYFFAQSRVDRGFDPSDSPLELRLDEYALRWTPWDDGRLSVQAGCFGTIVGTYVERHLSWENPFINAPLVYENMTAIYDAHPPHDAGDFASGLVDEKYDYNPVIWGPSYATGLSVSGRSGKLDYAVEIKNAGLSSRPESWNNLDNGFHDPTVNARVAYHPGMAWTLGVSASQGAYFTEEALPGLPPGSDLGDYKQQVLGQDVSFAWKHWQLWAELYQARFDVPHVGHANTIGYYLEAKYKFTPNLFGALRWNQQLFDDIPNGAGGEQPWGNDLARIDAAMTYRFTPDMQLKLQYSVQREEEPDDDTVSHLFATQFTVRF